jgi:hypothetical protein
VLAGLVLGGAALSLSLLAARRLGVRPALTVPAAAGTWLLGTALLVRTALSGLH